MTIDFDGITERVARVPLQADNYGGLTAKTGHFLYGIGSAFYYGRQGDRPNVLKFYSLKDRKETTLVEDGVATYFPTRSKVLVAKVLASVSTDATPQGDRTRKPVAISGLFVDRVPAEEWNRSLTKFGDAIAIGFMFRTCMDSIGSLCVSNIDPC